MSAYQDDYARLRRSLRRLAIAVGVFVAALFLLIWMLWSVASAHAETPAEPDTETLMVIPAALWDKVERALVFWHGEAQRLKAMKGCT